MRATRVCGRTESKTYEGISADGYILLILRPATVDERTGSRRVAGLKTSNAGNLGIESGGSLLWLLQDMSPVGLRWIGGQNQGNDRQDVAPWSQK